MREPALNARRLAYSGAMQTSGAAIDGRSTTLTAADGRLLAACWFEPDDPPHAVAVVSAAGGVPQGCYRAFAQWLAARGYAVLTYDYRGIGSSCQGPVRQDPARKTDWAVRDMSAALAAAADRADQGGRADRGERGDRLPLLLVGHSFSAATARPLRTVCSAPTPC